MLSRFFIPGSACWTKTRPTYRPSTVLFYFAAGQSSLRGFCSQMASSDTDSQADVKPTYEELELKVTKLEAHIKQLQNIIKNKTDTDHVHKRGRPLDFNRYYKRHVALKLAYLGWDYGGFAEQEDSDRTIEAHLFKALHITNLIESRETSNFSRCGRTDKGVSSFGQVVTLDVRTNLLEGLGVIHREDCTASERSGAKDEEYPYVQMLNNVLPAEIRVLGWCPVPPGFSARFDCVRRTYKYYFPESNLNLEAMTEAAEKLRGGHDFRNFCKMDVGNGIINYRRNILHIEIKKIQESSSYSLLGGDICELTIGGQAFLWHQIRCIVALLFLVAQGKEQPQIIDELFDVEKNPRKPQYPMASEIPLVLFDCEYDEMDWRCDREDKEKLILHLQSLWTHSAIKSTQLRCLLSTVCSQAGDIEQRTTGAQIECLVAGVKPREYRPVMDRPTCPSFEERLASVAKRRRTTPEQLLEQFSKRKRSEDEIS